MRPNYAQDAPPTELTVGDASFAIETDYRVWIDVMDKLQALVPADVDDAQIVENVRILTEVEHMIFGRVIDAPLPDLIDAIAEFAKGYPTAPMQTEGGGAQTYSFKYDLNEIIIAIRNQSGIDLSYRRKEPFHWWEFLLEFRTLCGDHYILNLMEARGYKGNDKELLRRKRMCALPVEYTAAEQAEIDAFLAMFEEGEHANQHED